MAACDAKGGAQAVSHSTAGRRPASLYATGIYISVLMSACGAALWKTGAGNLLSRRATLPCHLLPHPHPSLASLPAGRPAAIPAALAGWRRPHAGALQPDQPHAGSAAGEHASNRQGGEHASNRLWIARAALPADHAMHAATRPSQYSAASSQHAQHAVPLALIMPPLRAQSRCSAPTRRTPAGTRAARCGAWCSTAPATSAAW